MHSPPRAYLQPVHEYSPAPRSSPVFETESLVATFRVPRLTLQTPKLWLVGVATDCDARHACLRFFSFFPVFFFCFRFFSFLISLFEKEKNEKKRKQKKKQFKKESKKKRNFFLQKTGKNCRNNEEIKEKSKNIYIYILKNQKYENPIKK